MSNVYKIGVVQDKTKCSANQKQLQLYFVFYLKHILIFYFLKLDNTKQNNYSLTKFQ